MPQFRWSAIDGVGEIDHGVMEASDQIVVVDRLQSQGLIVLRADAADQLEGWSALFRREFGRARRRLDKAALTQATRELAIMLSAGQDLDRALRFTAEAARTAPARAILSGIRAKVRAGSSLAAALAAEPASFSSLYVGLVRAGEAGGELPVTLERLAIQLEKEQSLTAALQSALAYPALLVAAAGASVVLLLEYVLPQFVPIFEQAGAKLPPATLALMAAGAALKAALPWALLGGLAAFIIGRRALARLPYRTKFDRLTLKLPIIGTLMQELMAARFTRTFGSLLQNGVPLIAALEVTRGAIGNHAAAAAVEAASTAVRGGGDLTEPLAQSGLFPARTIQLLHLGVETARLGEMALKAAEIHDELARLRVQRLVSLALPAVTITMGLVVAAIIGSLLTALLSLNDLAM